MRHGTAAERGEDVDVIGHLHILPGAGLVLAPRHRDLGHGHHGLRGPDPSHHRLVPDAHVQDVVAAERGVLPPVQRLADVGEARLLGRLQLHGQHLADVTFGDEALHGRIQLERGRAGHELRHEVRLLARGLEHAPAFGRVHRHARFAEHVLAGLERGDRQLGVHVRPRADADRVDVRCPDHLPPVARDARDPELLRHALARFLRSIGDRHDLHPGLRLQLGDVMTAAVVSGAHEPYADRFVSHGATW